MAIIDICQLTKYYGKSLGIQDINLTVEAGEIFGFLGPNGAGKSTAIRLILNLLRPFSGEVRLFGKNVQTEYTEVFKRVGNVPGELRLYEELTGNRFLTYMNSFSLRDPKWREELICAFGLTPDDLNKKIRYYSHGMKQKLGIIQALQNDPDLIVMDEPSEGLDPINKAVLYEYLKKFKAMGRTIFFSSHYLAEVEKICDRVGLIRKGRLVTVESISALKEKMVRHLEVTFARAVPRNSIHIENAVILEQNDHRLVLAIQGNIDQVIKQLAQFEVKNLVFPEPSLQDTFLTFYEKE